MRSTLLASRRGVTLVEMAITVAIITILAVIGIGMINETLPRWRAREAAYSFAATVERARMLAVTDNIEYRVVITRFDELLGDGKGAGSYLLQRGNASTASSDWDTLPVELSPTDPVASNEGTFDFSQGSINELPGVGILEPGTNPPISSGPVSAAASSETSEPPSDPSTAGGFALGWGGNGVSTNPASDFTCDLNGDGTPDGVTCTVFFNDKAWARGIYEYFTVVVSRGGMVRVVAGDTANLVFGAGTSTTTHYGDGSGGGYAPGGSGGSGDTGGGGGGGEEVPEEPLPT